MAEAGDKVDTLGEDFEKPVEGCPKRSRVESAAIKCFRTGEGLLSAKPGECGRLPLGVQQGFIEEVDDSEELATMVAVAVAEMDEIEPSYEEAHMRSDWPEWRKAIDVELENLKMAGT